MEVKASNLSKVSNTNLSKSGCIGTFFDSMSWIKLGSNTLSWISFSDLVLNNERSNDKSKGISSKVDHSSGSEFALTNWLLHAWVFAFFYFLKILSGSSSILAGFGSGFSLVSWEPEF